MIVDSNVLFRPITSEIKNEKDKSFKAHNGVIVDSKMLFIA